MDSSLYVSNGTANGLASGEIGHAWQRYMDLMLLRKREVEVKTYAADGTLQETILLKITASRKYENLDTIDAANLSNILLIPQNERILDLIPSCMMKPVRRFMPFNIL